MLLFKDSVRVYTTHIDEVQFQCRLNGWLLELEFEFAKGTLPEDQPWRPQVVTIKKEYQGNAAVGQSKGLGRAQVVDVIAGETANGKVAIAGDSGSGEKAVAKKVMLPGGDDGYKATRKPQTFSRSKLEG